MSLLTGKDLSRFYQVSRGFMKPEAEVKALNSVSFHVDEKETLAIVGESGSGKSTLARLLVKAEQPTEGQLLYKGEDVSQLKGDKRRELQRHVRMIFQNPYSSLNPRWRVIDTLEEPLKLHSKLSKKERQQKVHEILDLVGLRPEQALRYPHMFSGGQRQRVAIARALILDPDIIVADEAVSALDVSIQAQILNLMQDLQKELNLAYVFISHDLGVVRFIADRLMVMYFGYAVEYGDASIIFERPKHPYTQFLLSSTPQLHKKEISRQVLTGELPSPLNPPSGCPFHGRCPSASDVCRQQMPVMNSHEGRKIACHHPL